MIIEAGVNKHLTAPFYRRKLEGRIETKRNLILFLMVVFLLSIASPFAAAINDTVEAKPVIYSVQKGQDIILENVQAYPEQGIYIITEALGAGNSLNISPMTDTDRQVVESFRHTIYGSGGAVLAVCLATVTGTCSWVDNWAQIDSITASFAGNFAHDMSYTTSTGGQNGYLYLYFNGLSLGTMTYKITPNGNISNI